MKLLKILYFASFLAVTQTQVPDPILSADLDKLDKLDNLAELDKIDDLSIFLKPVGPEPSPPVSPSQKAPKPRKKPKVLHNRSLLDSNNLKLFNSGLGNASIRIGILSMPVHRNMRKYLRRKGVRLIGRDMLYKQNLVKDRNQSLISWTWRRKQRVAKKVLRQMRKYSYYPTSYAKAFFGWNIFDYLAEKKGDPLVGLTRSTETTRFSGIDTTS